MDELMAALGQGALTTLLGGHLKMAILRITTQRSGV